MEETEAAQLRHDLSVLTLLVEGLYQFEFKRFPEPLTAFDKFAKSILEQSDTLTVPDVDAAVSDHAAASFSDALAERLAAIRQRLNPGS
jgi:hypothetical protein